MARMNAERKLREAEESLRKLGVAVDSQTMIIKEDVHQEMVVNVKKLKREIFFLNFVSFRIHRTHNKNSFSRKSN